MECAKDSMLNDLENAVHDDKKAKKCAIMMYVKDITSGDMQTLFRTLINFWFSANCTLITFATVGILALHRVINMKQHLH